MSTFQLALCSMFSMARTHDVKDQSESDLVYQKLYLTLFDQYNSMLPSVFAKRECVKGKSKICTTRNVNLTFFCFLSSLP
ncbi:hypothetical protein RB195_002144 [Necator americanus]|uniref:Neurotransmitter-gated ion-channel ligand-binding domain-containing protein n=1 Tax=Necator americanus TaxID=51031 RepID=A0ABR1DIC1_NECAM